MSNDGPEHDVFVSYASADRPAVARLAAVLLGAGLDVWIDTSGVDDFEGITATVAAALARSKVVLVCLSLVYLTRPACQWELCQAVSVLAGEDIADRVLVVQVGSLPPETELGILRDLRISSGSDPSAVADAVTRRVAALPGPIGGRPAVSVPSWPRAALASPSFTGRFAELLTLYGLLSPRAEIGTGRTGAHLPVVVAGMGGTGKTMLVEEYAARFPGRYPGGVIRLAGRSEKIDRFAADRDEVLSYLLQQLRTLAQAWGGPPQEQHAELDLAIFRAREAVRERLAGGGAVLWIVDDLPPGLAADDFSLFLCPDPDAGVTAITSRTNDYAGLAQVLGLDCLGSAESIALLAAHRRPAPGAETAAAGQIAQALGGHPLALDVTGARLRRGIASYPDVARRLTGGAALQGYEVLARSFRGELPTGHEVSIVTTLSDSVAALSAPAARGLQFAAICDPGFAVPARWASAVLFSGRGGQGTRDGQWLTDDEAVDAMSAALEELAAAHLAKAEGVSYLTHVLVAELSRYRLRDEAGRETESQLLRASLRWLAADPPVLVSPFVPVEESVAAALGWHTLTLLDQAVRQWEDSPAELRQDVVAAQEQLGYLFGNAGAEWLQKEGVTRFTRAVLAEINSPDPQAVEILESLASRNDVDSFDHARLRERIVAMQEALTGDDSSEVARALEYYLHSLRQVPLPGLAQAAGQRLAAMLEKQAAELEAADPDGHLYERLGILERVSAILEAGDPDRALALRHRLLRLVDRLGVAVSDPAVPLNDRLRAYQEMADVLQPVDPVKARAVHRELARRLRSLFDEKVSAGESGEELDWIVRRLAESLRVLGEQRSLEEIYELRDAANARPEPPSSGWPAGEPVDSADWVAQIRAVEGLKERNPEEALTRLRRFTEDILMMPGQEGARRKAWLLWRVFETTRSGWGIRDGDQAQWDEIQETASEACVDTALEHARSMRENPDYLTDLNAMAQLLMGTAIGGRRGLLVAAELYETLAGHLAAGQGDFASQVFAAWENAAESLDRADLDDDEIQARAKKIRSMLAARYGQAFDLELQASGLEHPKTLSYLSSYLEYLRSTDQKAEALNVSRRVYRQAIEQYGDGTEAAARILGVVGGYTEATDTMEDDPG